ncbi:serine-rich adhesin for platelets isoform X4 [Pimephales promelas]|uniref:serine-rich adhesin for platelets isoform X4 n=1 Tax=Pimephales promelas TaxID=90988 RepID=UPI0019556A77|nr:serine-rich adhesin for platelets isoform X4 [Pimephales promelas]
MDHFLLLIFTTAVFEQTESFQIIKTTIISNASLGCSTLGCSKVDDSTVDSSTLGSSTLSSTIVDDTSVDSSTLGSSTVDDTSVISSTLGSPTLSSTIVDNTSGDSSTLRSTIIDNTSGDSSTLRSTTVDSPTLGSSTLSSTTVDSPTLGSSTLSSTTVDSPTLGSSTLSSTTVDSPTLGSSTLSSTTVDSPTLGSSTLSSTTVDDSTVDSLTLGSSTLSSSTVNSSTLGSSTLSSSTVDDTSVDSTTLGSSTVSSSTVDDTSVDSTTLGSSTVSSSTVDDTSVDSSTLGSSTLSSTTVDDTSVSSSTLSSSTLGSSTLGSSTLDSSTLSSSTLSSSTLGSSTLNSSTLSSSTVNSSTLGSSTLSSSTVDNTSVDSTTLGSSTVSSSTVDDTSVDSTTLGSTTVSSSTVDDTSVDSSTLGSSTLSSTTVDDTSVSSSTLGSSTLGSSTLGSSTLSSSTLGSSTLGSSTLSSSTLGSSTLGSSTLGSSTLSSSTLGSSTLNSSTLGSSTLNSSTLGSSTLGSSTLNSSTLSSSTLGSSTLSSPSLSSSTFRSSTLTSTLQTRTQRSTTTAAPNTTMIEPSLVCENKGILQNGICLCPDDWTGTTCNISNFCPEQKTQTSKFTFPKTVLGQFASSVERCPSHTPNAGIPKASALCNISTHLFDPPNLLDCGLTLDTINNGLTGATQAEVLSLASSTQILTSIPERLTAHNITNAVNIANILLTRDETEQSTEIAVSAVATVSQLLNASHGIYFSVDQAAINELTQTLQKFSLREKSNPLLVQPNMAVQSLEGKTPIRQVRLTFFKGLSDTFLPDRIKLDTTQAEISKESIDFQMNVMFSEDFDKDVGFVLYDSDQFFQSKSFQPSLNTKRRVISANLQENLGFDHIEFAFTPSVDSTLSLNDFACVFWSYTEKDWSPEGCSKTLNSSGHVVCSCKTKNVKSAFKSANFAILMTFDINYQYSEALNWISITGCALSVLGLFVTAVYQIITRKSRGGSPTLLVVNICMSMTVFYLLFIFGINNPVQHLSVAKFSGQNKVPDSDHHKYPDEGPCTAFTALLQYFLLATFTWNTLYGVNVFLLFKNQISGTPLWFPKVSLAIGWEYNRSYIYKHLDSFELVDCNHQFEDQTKNIRIRLKSKVQLMGVM